MDLKMNWYLPRNCFWNEYRT